ncbi:hypothetical protein [Tunturiibacter lichenicola]|uniref:hypothetical protein n=1 Tax=Tunturiibacter lichenicola TaxID=2051959 RepID=UPI003D9BAB3E
MENIFRIKSWHRHNFRCDGRLFAYLRVQLNLLDATLTAIEQEDEVASLILELNKRRLRPSYAAEPDPEQISLTQKIRSKNALRERCESRIKELSNKAYENRDEIEKLMDTFPEDFPNNDPLRPSSRLENLAWTESELDVVQSEICIARELIVPTDEYCLDRHDLTAYLSLLSQECELARKFYELSASADERLNVLRTGDASRVQHLEYLKGVLIWDLAKPKELASFEAELEVERAASNSPHFIDQAYLRLWSERIPIGKQMNEIRRTINGRSEHFLSALNSFHTPGTSILRQNLALPIPPKSGLKGNDQAKNRRRNKQIDAMERIIASWWQSFPHHTGTAILKSNWDELSRLMVWQDIDVKTLLRTKAINERVATTRKLSDLKPIHDWQTLTDLLTRNAGSELRLALQKRFSAISKKYPEESD